MKRYCLCTTGRSNRKGSGSGSGGDGGGGDDL